MFFRCKKEIAENKVLDVCDENDEKQQLKIYTYSRNWHGSIVVVSTSKINAIKIIKSSIDTSYTSDIDVLESNVIEHDIIDGLALPFEADEAVFGEYKTNKSIEPMDL